MTETITIPYGTAGELRQRVSNEVNEGLLSPEEAIKLLLSLDDAVSNGIREGAVFIGANHLTYQYQIRALLRRLGHNPEQCSREMAVIREHTMKRPYD